MPKTQHILFLQKRSTRAGAQTSLARMMASSLMAELRPAVLLGSSGWLEDHILALGIPLAKTRFPRPRRLPTQLFGLGPFGRSASRQLREKGIKPRAIVANDHTECPLALELSRCHGGIPVLAILRTPGMTQRDFEKFRCNECDHLLVEGVELKDRVRGWTDRQIGLFDEGFADGELHEPLPLPDQFPHRVLVIGSEKPRKGFSDFIAALDLLEARYPDFPSMECDFTGLALHDQEELLAKPRRAKLRFIGRVNDYVNLVRTYPLAVHPSRAETFGMAPLEAILAGVPTLLSTTGVVEELEVPDEWKFPPHQPEEIAARLHALWKSWPRSGSVQPIQADIFEKFHIDRTVAMTRDALVAISGIRAQRKKSIDLTFSSLRKRKYG